MGKKKRLWQDVDYLLGYFGKTVQSARRVCKVCIKDGLDQGRRNELTGGRVDPESWRMVRSKKTWTKRSRSYKKR